MITGMHAIVFSPDAGRVRAFFADVPGLRPVDAGGQGTMAVRVILVV